MLLMSEEVSLHQESLEERQVGWPMYERLQFIFDLEVLSPLLRKQNSRKDNCCSDAWFAKLGKPLPRRAASALESLPTA